MTEIYSTGNPKMKVWIRPSEGEPREVIRAKAGISASLAGMALYRNKPDEAVTHLSSLGMGDENAQRIVDAAQQLIPEVGVRFRTVFENTGIGGPRRYEDFEPF